MTEPNEKCGPLRYDRYEHEEEPPLMPVWAYAAIITAAAVLAAAVGIVAALW